jgi:shikimate dehydrogenase
MFFIAASSALVFDKRIAHVLNLYRSGEKEAHHMRVEFNRETQRLAVIGDPIAHSLSPVIHNALYGAMGINAFYQPLFVPKGRIEIMNDAIPMLSLRGFNVTMPHKQAVFALLDEVGSSAQRHQSVNTVCVREGRLIGHSTDAQGFALALAARGLGFEGRDVVILGAGGVSGALALEAATNGARSVSILNRTPERADALASRVSQLSGARVQSAGFTARELELFAARATLLINATPLGMEGCGDFVSLVLLRALPKDAVVCDLIYDPPATRLLEEARALGHIAMNGLGMLIYQAFAAFEHFFGVMPGDNELRAVQAALKAERGIG